MTEWQIIDSNDFIEQPQPETTPLWRRWPWWLVAIGLLLALAGAWSLWQQRNQGRAALTEDLKAVILAEETNRFLGRPAAARYQADTPSAWRQSYSRSFEPQAAEALAGPAGLREPPVISIASIDYFDGQCALATLANAPHDPVRAYCLAETTWLRAPIPPAAWGDEVVLGPLPGLQLRFRARDRAFAEALAADLVNRAEPLPLTGLEIVLEPHDLSGPLILNEPGHIVLNSPHVLPASIGPGIGPAEVDPWRSLSSPEIVRLALERVLVSRSGRFQPALSARLPGADRFIEAAQTVLAMHALFEPATQDRVRENWRAILAGDWVSPFFADLAPQAGDEMIGRAEIAALLTAAYIYDHHGPEALSQLLARFPQAASWNQIFADLPLPPPRPRQTNQTFSSATTRPGRPEQSYTTLLLEIEVAHYAGATGKTVANLYRAYGQTLERPPFTTKLRYLDNGSLGQSNRFPVPRYLISPAGVVFNWPADDDRLEGWRLFVGQSAQTELTVVEAAPDLTLTTPDGLPLSPGCLGPGADLTIEGEWLEAPRRFLASQIIVQQALRLRPRATSSRANLFIEDSPESGAPAQLVALTAGGFSSQLLKLSPDLRLFPLPAAEGESQRLLIQSDVPTCSRSWFGLYEPGRGLIDYWFAPARPRQWVWRADQALPLFVKLNSDERDYQVYEANRSYTFGRDRLTGNSYQFLGWHLAERRLITADFHTYGSLLGLLDPAHDLMDRLAYLPLRAISSQSLSPAGDWLAYPTGVATFFGASNRLYLQRLDGHMPLTPLQFDPGQNLASLSWSPNLNRPALALLVGPMAAADTIRPTHLLWVDPNRPADYIEVAQAGDGEQFANPILCRSGQLLYVAKQDARYELRLQQLGQPATTLLNLEHSIYPLVCNR